MLLTGIQTKTIKKKVYDYSLMDRGKDFNSECKNWKNCMRVAVYGAFGIA